ncbi:FixH family protein [Parasphingopyxis sp.]|uniref:FixH family protein n=1 Tax=Parasphingopyxis sp. TaxID=1920299 RepID=UPI00260C245A|nr:FixH family protein [Parasphingopyxis sp.]
MMTKRFSGWHMTAILVCFFGIIAAVNFTMATFATRGFGGTVVDNSYVASQRFNDWLEAARRQDDLQWTETVSRAGEQVRLQVTTPDGALAGGTITATAEHPIARMEPVTLDFVETEPGVYVSDQSLDSGRWVLRIEITQGDSRKRVLFDLS